MSNRELITYAVLELDLDRGMPLDYQVELLRRFNLLAELDAKPAEDSAQLELFPETK